MGTRCVQVYTVRFLPGQELKSGLEHFVKQRQLQAAFIMTCVGSVQSATLRFATPAGENTSKTEMVKSFDSENFEICSLVGTLSPMGSHLHIVLGRADGSVVAGHVVGNVTVQTTAEVVIGESMAEIYNRKYDPFTCYNELAVLKRE
uniref:PPC domain-containing protein n=1 Tax=Homalodisca liturata TaxID=320908 RepID=A0A1B6JVF8_9HEMI